MANFQKKFSAARRALWEQLRSESFADIGITVLIVVPLAFVSPWAACIVFLAKEVVSYLQKAYKLYRKLYAEELQTPTAEQTIRNDVPARAAGGSPSPTAAAAATTRRHPPPQIPHARPSLKRIFSVVVAGILLVILVLVALHLIFLIFGPPT